MNFDDMDNSRIWDSMSPVVIPWRETVSSFV